MGGYGSQLHPCYKNVMPDADVCGICWYSKVNNSVCIFLFCVEVVVLICMVIIIILYHFYRKKAQVEVATRSFYTIFIFILFWLIARIIYFTDAFINWQYDILIVFSTLPAFCAYITIATSIYNVMHLCHVIEN